VVISGFEHNAVTRPLHAKSVQLKVAGRKLFDREDTLESFENALKSGADAAVFTHVSNVFGYILPVYEMGALCKQYGVPFVMDAAQGAGMLPIDLSKLGADFIAMPGHKGLLGPQGTGLLLCAREPVPLLRGGTGSLSADQNMPDFLPDIAEAGTLNVPGIAGLAAGIEYVRKQGTDRILAREQREARRCGEKLKKFGFRVFFGENQSGTVSFVPDIDCEDMARLLGEKGIAVRAGLHCAPLAHASAGTAHTGTVRVSFGHDAAAWQTGELIAELEKLAGQK
jgi:selenocysteine lyase/cysteine desulfurase